MQILSLGKFNNKKYDNISYKFDENTNRLYYIIYRDGSIDQIEDLIVNASSEIKDDGYIYTTITYDSGATLKKREEIKENTSSSKKSNLEFAMMLISYVFIAAIAIIGVISLI